jgi:hypothetical protein
MERDLRRGNLAALCDDSDNNNIQELQAQPTDYVPSQDISGPTHNPHGVRVAPVKMYDTKLGTDVLGANISGKARGKHQINYLMASAAALEAKPSKTKSHRASAKQKYGW